MERAHTKQNFALPKAGYRSSRHSVIGELGSRSRTSLPRAVPPGERWPRSEFRKEGHLGRWV